MTNEPAVQAETMSIGLAMDRCRERLDQLDTAMIGVIAERMQLCAEIARLKREGEIPMMQPHRLKYVRKKSIEEGRMHGLDERFVDRLIDVITQESCRLEDLIIDK